MKPPAVQSLCEPPLEWSFGDLLGVLRRRRAWIVASLALCSLLAILDWTMAARHYRATAEIEVRKESRGAFGLDTTTADRPIAAVSDSFDDNLTLQTETSVLESDAVTLDVIRRTGLEATSDYFNPQPSRIGFLRPLLFWRKPLEPLSTPLAEAPNRRYAALKIFARHRTIAPVSGTRLIAVSYSDPDPQRAAAVVDALIQALADSDFQSRSSAAAQSAMGLSAQLATLKQQTDALDARAAALDRVTGDYGDDDAHNVVLARLDSLNAALSTAESSRILREAIWRDVQSGNPELISSLGGNAGTATQNSFALLQSLRSQESQAQAQLAEAANRYGENWPGVAEQRARLATIQKSVQEEIGRLGERAHSDYAIALEAELTARDALNQQKQVASGLTGSAMTLRLARQEADESRSLYTSLLGRLQQAGVLEGLHSENFSVVSPALIPAPDHPSSPNGLLLAGLAVGVGLMTGCGAALLRELTDTTIHSVADLESLLEAPVFAAIPAAAGDARWYRRLLPAPGRALLTLQAAEEREPLLAAACPEFTESLRCLRASLLLSHSSRAPQVITVSSADRRSEDSQGTALGLATVLAQHGSPTLFLDADLRSAPAPGNATLPGLSEMLSSDTPPVEPRERAGLPLLSILHAGTRPPCPSELIASARMSSLLAAWRDRYSFIVIHGPAPAYADGLVLAQVSDAVLLAARAGETNRDTVLSAWNALNRQVQDHAVLGLILEEANA
ncbi:MAG: polysaccharide biosynthesis tyrosine autokinase [Acidobacteriaceae bacterium]